MYVFVSCEVILRSRFQFVTRTSALSSLSPLFSDRFSLHPSPPPRLSFSSHAPLKKVTEVAGKLSFVIYVKRDREIESIYLTYDLRPLDFKNDIIRKVMTDDWWLIKGQGPISESTLFQVAVMCYRAYPWAFTRKGRSC